jgi:hypothetical protein
MVVYRCQYYSSYKLYICQKVSEKGSLRIQAFSYKSKRGLLSLHKPDISNTGF